MIRSLVSCPGRALNAVRCAAPALALMVGMAAVAVPASAASEEVAAPMEELQVMPPRLRVGDATTNLLALQRSGQVASPVAQSISGEVASRSYARYLKSFEYPIPEKLGGSGTQGATSIGGGDSSSTPTTR